MGAYFDKLVQIFELKRGNGYLRGTHLQLYLRISVAQAQLLKKKNEKYNSQLVVRYYSAQ